MVPFVFLFIYICFFGSNCQELGDLGLVAKASRSSQSMMRKPDALTVTKVFNTLRLIAKVHYLLLFQT